jgi:hypothetical protein
MRSRSALPVPLSLGPFRTSEALSAGVPASRLRSEDVAKPFRGLNIPGSPPTDLRARVEALLPLFRTSDAFSHTTAAALWGIPVPRSETRLHVTSVDATGRFRRPGVVGHRVRAIPVTMVGVLPVVEPAPTWVQLASLLHHDDLVAAGDYLVTPRRIAREPAIASIDALRAAIPRNARGAARARSALHDVRAGAESPMETRLRLLLVRSGLPEPELNPPVETAEGVFHPDLFYPQWRLAIEYLGDQHRTDPREWARDIRRREAFEQAGNQVVPVTRDDVLAERERFLARLCRAIAQRQRV